MITRVKPSTSGMQTTRRNNLRGVLLLAGIGIVYFLAAFLCLALFSYPEKIPILWLPSGIILTVLWIKPRRNWPLIFLTFIVANLLACLAAGVPLGAVIGFSFTYAIEALLVILMIQRSLGQKIQALNLKQMGLVVITTGTVFVLTSLMGATIAFQTMQAPFFSAWATWFLADALGSVLLIPIGVSLVTERPSFTRPSFTRLDVGQWIEIGIILVLMTAITWFLLFSQFASSGLLYSMPYLAYPFIFWAAFRLGMLGASSASFLLVGITLASTLQGFGPFITVDTSVEYRIFSIQLYLVATPLFAWMVVALMNERRTLELAWQSSEKRLRSILQNAPVYVGQIDPTGKLAFNNWNISNDKDSNALFTQLLPEADIEFQQAVENAQLNGRPWLAELEAAVNYKRSWFEVRLSPILADGKVESIILTAEEITERKQAEEALRISEERFSVAVRGANDGIWDWELSTNLIYFSQRCKKMLGYNEDDIGSSPDEWLGRVHPDDIKQVKDDLAAHIQGYTPHFITEHRIMHRSGSYRWVLMRGLAVRIKGKQAHRLAGSLTDITARKTTEERLLHDAMHDILTGLPNRTYFLDQLRRSIQRIKRHNGEYWNAVLFIDLDRFKLVNESFGHLAGDQLLIETARRLENSLRPQDTVARFGGDEFAILLDDIKAEEDAIRVVDRVQAMMANPFDLQHQEVFTTVSIGIVVNDGSYESAEDLLGDSNTALYEAKANGRGRHKTFDTNMRMRSLALLQLETDLRRAIERQEFEVYYQPIVSLPSGTITSMEALIRWHHPDRGMIMPSDFIPVAEENGLIVPINDWVIRTACHQLKTWQKINPNLRMSVNLAARQLQNHNLPDQFKQILTEAGIESSSLQLEVTESAAMEGFDLQILTQLSEMGIQISLDDFGMRYNSLDYLKNFPANTIKIDKSFVGGIPEDGEDAAITRMIISVGHLLNKCVVAEGVETTRQLDFLHVHQCDAVQGFLYSQPQNPHAITLLLEHSPMLNPIIADMSQDEIE